MDLLKPEYNIDPTAGSRLGSLHDEEARAKMRAAHVGRELSVSQKLLVSDLTTNTKHSFFSMRKAGKVLGVDRRYIAKCLNDLSSDKQPFLDPPRRAARGGEAGIFLRE